MQPRVDLAAERLEQAELAEPLDPVGAQTAELVEDPLARRPGEERGLRARQLLGRRVEPEAELALEPHPAQEPQRVVVEDGVRDGAQRLPLDRVAAVERVEVVAPAHRQRDRVRGEVAPREVLVDRLAAERREVDGAAAVEHHAPRAELLVQREHRVAVPGDERPRGALRLAAGDVEVERRTAEQLVADRAADDPGLLLGEQLGDQIQAEHQPSTTVRRARSALELMPQTSS